MFPKRASCPGGGFSSLTLGASQAHAVDVGANPAPQIDIAVNVPSDYEGTFLDFKQELTAQLIEQGLDPSTFRITNTAVSIDTNDLNGWYVYDHYRNDSCYDALKLSAEQKLKQPKRITVDNSTTGDNSIEAVVNKNTNKFTINKVANLNHHILSYLNEQTGTSNMAFAGYGTKPYADWMLYPASSSSTRSFSFNIDASVINTHTLTGFGFFMNAGVEDGKLYGYLLYFDAGNAYSGTGAVSIKKINGISADSETTVFTGQSTVSGADKSFSLGSQKKVRLTCELKENSLTIQQQAFSSDGNLSDPVNVLTNFSIPQFYGGKKLNGFGPWVGYSSHGCTDFSSIIYTDLAMSYEASAFDALKNVQYYQGADQKYFINLAGESGDSGVPDEYTKGSDPKLNEGYADGIKRMIENEIFYISNDNDGQVITDPTKNEDGSFAHRGIGSMNGAYTPGDDHVALMAEYIAKNYFDKVKFTPQETDSEIPLANFYLKDMATGNQIMTLHQQHLVNTNQTVEVNIQGQSKTANSGAALTNKRLVVYNPDNTVVYDSGWVNYSVSIPNYQFTKDSAAGRWSFELAVRDANGKESKAFQTYLTAFKDTEHPTITGENQKRNMATITLTDTGQGIDDDGITFIEDGRGSGVAYYYITNDESFLSNSTTTTPTKLPDEEDWIQVPGGPVHSYTFDEPIVNTDPMIVLVRDECGNVGVQAVFQPVHVVVKDKDDNDIEDYYVITDEPIVVLPDDPEPDDPDDEFAVWETPGGDPVTPGTPIAPPHNNEIIIRPVFTNDTSIIAFNANGGTLADSGVDVGAATTRKVPAGSSVLDKVSKMDIVATRNGYDFVGWKIGTAEVTDQVTVKDGTVTLTAQWEARGYKLFVDGNGGTVKSGLSYEVPFASNIFATSYLPTSGMKIPVKPGYTFQGWSTTKVEPFESDQGAAALAAVEFSATKAATKAMPASDITVYAVWLKDASKFVVSFDAQGGDPVKDQAYNTQNGTTYNVFRTPSRSGYDFLGWFTDPHNGTEVQGETTIPTDRRKDHTLYAHWQARSDSSYIIEHYVRSDANPSGYEKVAAATESVSPNLASGSTIDLTDDTASHVRDMRAGNYGLSDDYWFNASTSTLTGELSPKLVLRFEYFRYFDVSTDAKGPGTVEGASLNLKEGDSRTVTWAPAANAKVASVTIDGQVRDDLIAIGSYTFDNLKADHRVSVVFEEEKEAPKPIVPDPGSTSKEFFDIVASIEGCTDGTCTITGNGRVKKGEDAQIAWKLGEGYAVTSVTIDGVEHEGYAADTVDLTEVQGSHSIVVTVQKNKLPTIGGNTTDGKYTITVNRYGGIVNDEESESVFVSESKTVAPGDQYKLTVKQDSNKRYTIYKVMLDGKTIFDLAKNGSKGTVTDTRRNISANHTYDVYFCETPVPDEEGNTPDPVLPDFEDKSQFITINTKIEGGEGTITGGAVIEKPKDGVVENVPVEWTVGGTNEDVDSANYRYYDVDEVQVTSNGETKIITADDLAKSGYDLENLEADASVVVKVKPVTYDVDVYKYGNGTVAASKTLYKNQNYTEITAVAADGHKIARVYVDGKSRFENKEAVSVAALDAAPIETLGEDSAADEPVASPASQIEPTANDLLQTSFEAPISDAGVEVDQRQDAPEEESADSDAVAVDQLPEPQQPEEQPATEDKSPIAALLDVVNPVEEAYADDPIDVVTVDKDDSTNQFNKVSIRTIGSDHEVRVYFVREDIPWDDYDKELPQPNDPELFKISGTITGGTGEFNGQALVKKGESAEISWSTPSGFNVTDVKINGQSVSIPADNKMTLTNVDKNTQVEVVVAPKKPLNNDERVVPTIDGEEDVAHYRVNTKINGASGSITNSASLAEGATYAVNWDAMANNADPSKNYQVLQVKIDGKLMNRRATSRGVSFTDDEGNVIGDATTGGYTFYNIKIEHNVVVTVGPVSEVNKDGDPEVNIDTNGDGIPDVNIDTDGDGVPDVNVDTKDDGIWKPDTNVDKGNGEFGDDPTPPVDEDGDGIDDNWKPEFIVFPDDDPEKPAYSTTYVPVNRNLVENATVHVKVGTPVTNDDILAKAQQLLDEMGTNLPEGLEVSLEIIKDGQQVEGVDTSKPGIYNATVTYTDEYGNTFQVHIQYVIDDEPNNGNESNGGDDVDEPNGNGSNGAGDADDPNGNSSNGAGAGDKSSSDDKGGKSDSDKTRLSQTGDQLMPLMATMALLAMASLFVAMGAGRRTRRAKAGKHAR